MRKAKVILLIASICIALVSSGCRGKEQPEQTPPPKAPERNADAAPSGGGPSVSAVVSQASQSAEDAARIEYLSGLAFDTEKEVLEKIGNPVAMLVDNEDKRTFWYYKEEVITRFGTPANMELQFVDGEVISVQFWPPENIDEKIGTARLYNGVKNPPGPRKRSYTYQEAYNAANQKPDGEVLAAFGEPNEKSLIDGRVVWQYNDLVVEPDGTRMLLAVAFEGGVASEIQGMGAPSSMDLPANMSIK